MGEDRGLEKDWDRSWGASFDAVSNAYDAVRPGYPNELYRDLANICGLGEDIRVLEVGCGTGQATEDIAPLARSVVALEPGVNLANRARTRLKGFRDVDVWTSTFEDFGGEPESFHLIVSATAFHWVEPEIGFIKAAELLRPGGWLALWWTSYQDPDGDDPFGEEVSQLLGSRGFAGHSGPSYGLRGEDRVSDFDRSRAFGPVVTRYYRWTGRHSAKEIRTLFSTYSNIQALDESDRVRILDGIEEIATTKSGGHVTRPYVTVLYAARKVANQI